MENRVNILTLKWGDRYDVTYVNRLFRGVCAHLSRPFRFVCVTDDPAGLAEGIDAQPFPEMPPEMHLNARYPAWPNIYVKLLVFRRGFADLSGPTLFLDIDQIVTGDLDCFFDYAPGAFCIIRNWVEFRKTIFRRIPFCGNSSVFRFEAGEASDDVYRRFIGEAERAMDPSVYSTEQQYLTQAVGRERIRFWPDNFVRSFKRSCTRVWPLNHILAPKFNPDTRILCFHGHPSPTEAITGYRGRHLNTWTLPCDWVRELWEK